MAYTREDAQHVESKFFGENVEISDIQKLFAQIKFYKNAVKIESAVFGEDHVDTDDLEETAEELENEIDKVMPSPCSANYNKHLAMKAFTYFIRGELCLNVRKMSLFFPSLAKEPKYLKECIRLLYPIRFSAEASSLYIRSLNILGSYYEIYYSDKSLEYLMKAENFFQTLKGKNDNSIQKAMTVYQIFGATKMVKPYSLIEPHHITNMLLYKCFDNLNQDDKKLEYVMRSIKAKLFVGQRETNGVYNIMKIFLQIEDEIELLIDHYYFAQVNHLLAIGMCHLVKYRRSLPENRRYEVNYAQALVSKWFAKWAYKLIRYSFFVLNDWDKNSNKINTKFESLDDLKENGIEIYENQFPCELIVTKEQFKNAIKKGLAWTKRAIDMNENPIETIPLQLLKNDFKNFKPLFF